MEILTLGAVVSEVARRNGWTSHELVSRDGNDQSQLTKGFKDRKLPTAASFYRAKRPILAQM